jgi:hypothetical protein
MTNVVTQSLPIIEKAERVFDSRGIRIVGATYGRDDFGDPLVLVHPHINDLITNSSDLDPLIEELELVTGWRVTYRPNDNAILMKPRLEK